MIVIYKYVILLKYLMLTKILKNLIKNEYYYEFILIVFLCYIKFFKGKSRILFQFLTVLFNILVIHLILIYMI